MLGSLAVGVSSTTLRNSQLSLHDLTVKSERTQRGTMAKLAPVNPDVLRWAMGESGVDARELAHRAGIAEGRVQNFLAGAAEPQTGEFRALAKALNRSLAALLLPSPPASRLAQVAFRAPAGRSGDKPLHAEENVAIREAHRWQRIAAWLDGRSETSGIHVPLPTIHDGAPVSTAATLLCRWLQWDIAAQKRQTSSGALLKYLRSELESRGVLVLQFQLNREDCKGFCLPHSSAPAIALNTRFNAASRVYTIFHELAHIARGDRAVCRDVRDDALERWCEEVAAEILMPQADLIQYLQKIRMRRAESVDECRRVANHYNVSLLSAAVQLKVVGRAGSGLYGAVHALSEYSKSTPMRNAPPQTTPVIRMRQFGEELPRRLLTARDRGVLTDVQVRRYLNVNEKQLNEVADLVLSGASEA